MVHILRDLRWLDVKQRHKLHTAVVAYEVKHYLAQPIHDKVLSNVSEVSRYNTRASLSADFSVPTSSLNTKMRTFLWRATQL